MSFETARTVPNRPRAILHVITGLEVGGAETVLAHVTGAAKAAGQKVMVAAIRGGGGIDERLRAAGVPLVYVQRSKAPADATFGMRRLLAECASFAPDLIVGWMYHGALLAQIIGRMTGRSVPVIWNFRCTIDDSPNWPLATRAIIRMLRFLSGAPRKIIYNSEAGRLQHERYGFARPNSVVIGNGVNTRLFAPDAGLRTTLRAELGIAEGTVVFGHVARFHKMKAHWLLLDAVAAGSFAKEICVVMAGKGVDLQNPLLAERVARLKDKCRVLLLGERPDVHRTMNIFDVMCLTSSGGEGFPNVLAEAMASGVPCVATDVGDAGAIIAATGIVVPPNDQSAFAGALARMASLSAEERRATAAAARARVAENFSLQHMILAYDRLFNDVTSA